MAKLLRNSVLTLYETRPTPPVYWKDGKLYHAVCRFELQETNQLPAPEIYLWCWRCHTGVATWQDILEALRR